MIAFSEGYCFHRQTRALLSSRDNVFLHGNIDNNFSLSFQASTFDGIRCKNKNFNFYLVELAQNGAKSIALHTFIVY